MGHLCQGRYKAILVDADSYLLELVCYLHLNPVRTGLVDEPDRYRWSGHRSYLNEIGAAWLSTNWILSQFGSHSDNARVRNAKFVMDGIGELRQEKFHTGNADGRLLGGDGFIERALRKANQRVPMTAGVEDIVGCVCRHLDVEADRLSSRERAHQLPEAGAWTAVLAVEVQAVTLTELGRRFNRDVATLSNGTRQLRERISKNADLADRLAKMQRELMQKTKA